MEYSTCSMCNEDRNRPDDVARTRRIAVRDAGTDDYPTMLDVCDEHATALRKERDDGIIEIVGDAPIAA